MFHSSPFKWSGQNERQKQFAANGGTDSTKSPATRFGGHRNESSFVHSVAKECYSLSGTGNNDHKYREGRRWPSWISIVAVPYNGRPNIYQRTVASASVKLTRACVSSNNCMLTKGSSFQLLLGLFVKWLWAKGGCEIYNFVPSEFEYLNIWTWRANLGFVDFETTCRMTMEK